MGKLKLDIDALAVESFETTQPGDHEGTILGNQLGRNQWASLFHVTCDASCPPCGGGGIGTWWQSCSPGDTLCGDTCQRTCFVTYQRTCFVTCAQVTCGFTCYHTCHLSCQGTCGATCQYRSCVFHCTVNVSCQICPGTFQG